MAGWLGPLIGAAGSILGGALGGSEKQKGRSRSNSHTRNVSVTSTRGRVEDMVRAAERNGFNPLTFLRAGGLASFTNSATRGESWSNSFSRTRGSSQSSGPLGAGIAQAATIIGGAVSDNANSQPSGGAAAAWQGPSAQAAIDSVNKQLAEVQPGTLGTQPRHAAKRVETVGPWDGSPEQPEKEAAKVSNPWGSEEGIKVDPRVPNPDGRYEGEISENVNDGYRYYKDFKQTVRQSRTYQDMLKMDRNFFNMGDRLVSVPSKAVFGTLKANLWDPAAIAVVENPVYTKGSDLSGGQVWTKKPEFVDGGPKW